MICVDIIVLASPPSLRSALFVKRRVEFNLMAEAPAHGHNQSAHISGSSSFKLALNGQRIDGTLDAAVTLAIFMANKNNELNDTLLSIMFFGSYEVFGILHVAVNNELSAVRIEPLAQVVVLGVDISGVISGFGVMLRLRIEQSNSIVVHTSITALHTIVRTLLTAHTIDTTADSQSLHNFLLIHKTSTF
jgi:hypothetical protein